MTLSIKSAPPSSDSVKAKAAITRVSGADGVQSEVRLYDRMDHVPGIKPVFNRVTGLYMAGQSNGHAS